MIHLYMSRTCSGTVLTPKSNSLRELIRFILTSVQLFPKQRQFAEVGLMSRSAGLELRLRAETRQNDKAVVTNQISRRD